MLNRLELSNFTVFKNADIRFSKGLNVLIGENGTGKSHLLKLGYGMNKIARIAAQAAFDKDTMGVQLASALVNLFKPDALGRLATRQQGQSACEVCVTFRGGGTLRFAFSTKSSKRVESQEFNITKAPVRALFIPPKEVLSIYPGFAQSISDRELAFDDTYHDLCRDLERRPLKGPRFASIAELLTPLEAMLGGSISQEGEQFYLKSGKGILEVQLLAEGYRKIGQIAYLLKNGSLMHNGILFWDEPETNLNPKNIKNIATMLIALVRYGIQVVIATHSLFLMRELHIQNTSDAVPALFTELFFNEDGAVQVKQEKELDRLPKIAALEEELSQSDRFLNGRAGE